MKKNHACLFVLFLAIFLMVFNNGYASASQARRRPEAKYKAGEVLIKFKPGVSGAARGNVHAMLGASLVKGFPLLGIEHVRLERGLTVEKAVEAYERNPNVEYAEPNYIVTASATPDDLRFSELWGLHNTGQTGGAPDADIDAPEAWDITTGSSGVVVAVIDTGVDYTHEDLAQNMWVNDAEYYGTAGVDDDGNGYIDDIYGIDVINSDTDPMDDHFHGTHVSGTIGAVGNNGVGVVGVNWDVRIIACKFLDSFGTGDDAGAIECLEYIRALKAGGVNVVASNNSWGGSPYAQALYDAIDAQRDILFIAAAGNEGHDNDVFSDYPSGYYLPNLLSVAATDHTDVRASFSNYGRHTVHLGAPGVDILSSVIGNIYEVHSGTSMAAPHVTGLVALLKSQDMTMDWRAIKNLALSGGESTNSTTITGSRLNAYGSLTCADNPVFSALKYPEVPEIGVPATLSALSINCAVPVGPVTVTVSGGEVIELFDDGVAPDLGAGDGIFSATWTPSTDDGYMHFSSPSGCEKPLFEISTIRLSEASTYASYSQTLEARRGTLPYTWSIYSGSLPEGLALNSSTGEITGTPTEIGDYDFVVQVMDAESVAARKTLGIAVTDETVIEVWSRFHEIWSYEGYDVAVDGSGNVYVTGLSLNGDDLTIKYDPAGNVIWARSYDSGFDFNPQGIAVDGLDNVYVSGISNGTGSDYHTIKYDPAGNVIWARSYDNGYEDYAFDVAVDGLDNVYVSGLTMDGTGSCDYLTVKYDPAGNVIWARSYDGGFDDIPHGVAVDGSGNVYVTGETVSGTYPDFLTVKYDPAGNVVWTRTYDGGNYDSAHGIAVDGSGNVYVTGEIWNVTDYDFLVIKYDPAGNVIWTRTYDGGNYDSAHGIAVDGSGNVYVTGETVSGTYPDFLTIKYDPAGNVVWSKTTNIFWETAYNVAVDDSGNVYVTGVYRDIRYHHWSTIIKYRTVFGITTKTLPNATLGVFYGKTLMADGGLEPYTWAITSGSLPTGLALDGSTGAITGTPTAPGTFNFTVKVTDAGMQTDSRALSMSVCQPLLITTSSLPDGYIDAAYSQTLVASGGMAPYTWAITSGSLPTGLSLDGLTGAITGTPSALGTFTFTVWMMDAAGQTVAKDFSIQVIKVTTYSIHTASSCSGRTYKQAPVYAVLAAWSEDCPVEDTVSSRFAGTEDMLIGYLFLGSNGYEANMQIIGSSTGNSLSFLAKDSDGTGYVQLVEVDPEDGTVIQVLSTVTVPLAAGVQAYVADISGLSGTVSAGNSFGIILSMSTSSRSVNEIKWGMTGVGAGLEQWVKVFEMLSGN